MAEGCLCKTARTVALVSAVFLLVATMLLGMAAPALAQEARGDLLAVAEPAQGAPPEAPPSASQTPDEPEVPSPTPEPPSAEQPPEGSEEPPPEEDIPDEAPQYFDPLAPDREGAPQQPATPPGPVVATESGLGELPLTGGPAGVLAVMGSILLATGAAIMRLTRAANP